VFPTFSALAGVPLPARVVYDGRDMSAVLLQPQGRSLHNILWIFGSSRPNDGPAAARMGRWKAHWITGPGLGGCSATTPVCPTTGQPACQGVSTQACQLPDDRPLVFDVAQDPSEAFPVYGATNASEGWGTAPLDPGSYVTTAQVHQAVATLVAARRRFMATFPCLLPRRPCHLVAPPDLPGEGAGRYGVCCDRDPYVQPSRATPNSTCNCNQQSLKSDDSEGVVVVTAQLAQQMYDAEASVWNPYPVRGKHIYNVRDYGAIGDNSTLDTAAIQRAIDAAAKAISTQEGLAYVRVPAGAFLIASVNMSSGVYLVLEAGGVLQGSHDPLHYAYDWQQWNVVQGHGVKNTGVIGPVDGQMGGEIRGSMWQMISGWDKTEHHFLQTNWRGTNNCSSDCRPMNLAFVDSVNISVIGIRIMDSAFWTQLFRRCTNVVERGVHVEGATQYGNNDGLDIESCTNVTVSDSVFITGDDCIAMRSGHCQKLNHPWPLDPTTGRIQPTRGIRLRNLTLTSTSAAIKVEALFQTNHGDLFDLEAKDIRILRTNRGIGVWQRNGNGTLQDLVFRDITIQTQIQWQPNFWGSGEPIVVTSFPSDDKSSVVGLKGIRNITFDSIIAHSEGGILLSTFPGPDTPSFPGRGAVSGLIFRNVSLTIVNIGNSSNQYGSAHEFAPVWGRFADGPVKRKAPVDGMFVDGVSDIRLEDVRIAFNGSNANWSMQCLNITARSPLVCEDGFRCENGTVAAQLARQIKPVPAWLGFYGAPKGGPAARTAGTGSQSVADVFKFGTAAVSRGAHSGTLADYCGEHTSFQSVWGMTGLGDGKVVNNPNDRDTWNPPASGAGMIQAASHWSAMSKACPQIAGIIIDDFIGHYYAGVLRNFDRHC
jgi:polygalacturonase